MKHWLFFIALAYLLPLAAGPGMFMDGLYYANVAHNQAQGLGSFWQPYFSEAQPYFIGHPP